MSGRCDTVIDHRGENGQRLAELGIRNGERVKEADDIAFGSTGQQQQALFHCHLLNGLRGAGLIKLHGYHRTQRTHVSNIRMLALVLLQFSFKSGTEFNGTLTELLLFNHIQNRVR